MREVCERSFLASIAYGAILILLTGTAAQAAQFQKIGDFGEYAHQRIPVDARGEALNLAAGVDPVGPTAHWWNPAPLLRDDALEASYTAYDFFVDGYHWRPFALRATWRNFSIGVVRTNLSFRSRVQTAYDPVGEDVEIDQDTLLIGVAADVARWLFPWTTRWSWSVGANLKQYGVSVDRVGENVYCPDLGMTLAGWVAATEDLDLRILGTATVRNLIEGSLNLLDAATFFRYYQYGIGLEARFGHADGGRPLVTRLACAWRRDLEDHRDYFDSDNIGIEVTYRQIVTLRGSHTHANSYVDDVWAWGAGLQHHCDGYHGLHVALDYGSAVNASPLDDHNSDQWTFTAGIDLH